MSERDELVEFFLLMVISFDAVIDGELSLRRKRMRMTAKILDGQDEMVDLPLKAMSFNKSISFISSLEKTKNSFR